MNLKKHAMAREIEKKYIKTILYNLQESVIEIKIIN